MALSFHLCLRDHLTNQARAHLFFSQSEMRDIVIVIVIANAIFQGHSKTALKRIAFKNLWTSESGDNCACDRQKAPRIRATDQTSTKAPDDSANLGFNRAHVPIKDLITRLKKNTR